MSNHSVPCMGYTIKLSNILGALRNRLTKDEFVQLCEEMDAKENGDTEIIG